MSVCLPETSEHHETVLVVCVYTGSVSQVWGPDPTYILHNSNDKNTVEDNFLNVKSTGLG